MGSRSPLSVGVFGLSLLTATVIAQKPLPRLADGHPDLQGFWDNSTLTPLERPAALGDRASFTAAEAAEYESPAQVVERLATRSGAAERLVNSEVNSFWRVPRTLDRDRRASLIVDPPNGRVPALSATARARRDERAASQREHPADHPEELTLSERCLIWGADPPLIPVADNNVLQIVQTPGAVLILHEMMHDFRVVPTDGRPHLPPAIRQWKGDARGRWDGDTLVVDTTNFTDQTRFLGSGTALRVVERFTRTDANTLQYDFTVEDPQSFAAPFSGRLWMTRIDGPVFEYACHEANYSMPAILSAARSHDRERER